MEYMNRSGDQTPPHNAPEQANQQPSLKSKSKPSVLATTSKGLRIAQVVLLGCITVLIVAALVLLAINDNKSSDKFNASNENLLVDTSKYQTVFFNNGQSFYFGKIKTLNKDYLTLSDIYYLQVDQQVQPGEEGKPVNPVLKKLGCELHRPQDTMVINRSQVTFWENLTDNSNDQTIPGAIKKYKAANPGPQKCDTPAATPTPAPSPSPTPTPAR